MPCSDSSSSIMIQLDHDERFISFEYAKITCGREITAETGFNRHLVGLNLETILELEFEAVCAALNTKEEETLFILHMEWSALRAAIAQYLGRDESHYDAERCFVSSIDYHDSGIDISEVILPPKELPKILPCSLNDQIQNNRIKS